MESHPKSHPAITAAGVVAIVFGVLGVLGSIFVEVSLLAVSHISSESKGVPFPEAARAMGGIVWLLILAVNIFGIFVGAYILRRRAWARIAILIWGGLMTVISAITIVTTLLVLTYLPPAMPNAAGVASVLSVMKWVLTLLYLIPLGVGIWWLILFTRKAVVEEFNPLSARLHPGKTLDASGFPQEALEAPSYVPGGPSCPLPLIIIAGLDIFSGASTLAILVIPYSLIQSIPLFLFGHVFYGGAALVFLALLGIVYLVCGIGVIKLKPWALDPLIGFKALLTLSGIVTIMNPHFMPMMREAILKMIPQFGGELPANADLPANMFFFSDTYFKSMMAFGFLFVAAILAVLIVYRKRFLEAARAKQAPTG